MLGPSSFPGDPYGHLTNQSGHAYLVGAPMALGFAGLPPIAAPFVIGALYWIIWEWGIQRGKDWRDSLEDAVHVTAGAAVMTAALGGDILTVAGCMVAQGVLLAVGVYRRARG